MTENVKEKSLMSDNASYQIHAFMRNQLNLKGNELLVYAVIYSFTTKGDRGYFYGTRKFLTDYTGAENRTLNRTLKSLVEKGLIIKGSFTTRMGKFTTFRANLDALQNEEKSISDRVKTANTPSNSEEKVADTPSKNDHDQWPECPPPMATMASPFIIDSKANKKEKKKGENVGDTSAVGGQASEVNQSGVPKTPLASNNQTGNTNSSKKFQPPTLQEVTEYFEANELKADPEDFYYYYDAIGWYKGKNKIVNWKSAVHSWVKKQSQFEDKSKDEEEETEGGKEYYDIYSDPDFHFGEVPPDRRF